MSMNFWGDYKFVFIVWEVIFNGILNVVNKKGILIIDRKNTGSWIGEWREIRDENLREY